MDRPSLSGSETKAADKEHSKLLVAAKVRCAIVCVECNKPRCVYAATRLHETEKNQLEQVVQSRMYTCGSELFPPESPLHDTVICRQSLNCCDTMETQYFSSICVKFRPVCYFCGSPEETLSEDECVQTLKKQYAVVRPICFLCRSDGKRPATWGASNVAKRSKP